MVIFNRTPEPPENDGIRILRRADPLACGGTDAVRDEKAPKVILSDHMILFDVTSALGGVAAPEEESEPALGYVSAFAAPVQEGTFLFLETADGFFRNEPRQRAWALVTQDAFPALVQLVRECDLAASNGFFSKTHGLPENFGGWVDIRYANDERIAFANNQSPVLSFSTARKIVALFDRLMRGERITLPDPATLRTIHYTETRPGGGFTDATLTMLPDGTGHNEKSARYDDPRVYQSQKTIDADTVTAIKVNLTETGLLAWAGLPDADYRSDTQKALTFTFADGAAITVRDWRRVPNALCNGFFNIELEMTTKG